MQCRAAPTSTLARQLPRAVVCRWQVAGLFDTFFECLPREAGTRAAGAGRNTTVPALRR